MFRFESINRRFTNIANDPTTKEDNLAPRIVTSEKKLTPYPGTARTHDKLLILHGHTVDSFVHHVTDIA